MISHALNTRNLSAEAAARRLATVLARIPQPTPDILFLKIDSAGRGPIGASILAALEESACEWALVTPAFPIQGRYAREGILHVAPPDGCASGNPTQIPLKMLFPDSAQPMLDRIPRTRADGLAPRISAAIERGRRILLCDAETADDLTNLAEAARQIQHGRILWCGSAALARAVAGSYFSNSSTQSHTPAAFHTGRRCLLFVGTPHPVTSGQMEAIDSMGGVLRIDPSSVPAEIPEDTRCVAVRVRCGEMCATQIRGFWTLARNSGGVNGVVLTGGDTASVVLRALDARSILIQGEVAAGIPWGIVEGGMADGIRVITKSGGFGARTALVDAINFVERNR